MRRFYIRAVPSAFFLTATVLVVFLLRRPLVLPNVLLAKAYGEQRTLELRTATTKYSPLRVMRGQQSSHLERPQDLLDAEAIIARGLQKSPEDSSLLEARGEANLLEGSYEAAITDMQQALEAEPKSPTVLNGLATAYFERAESESRFDDYGTAFELQSRALQLSPENPIILFNRAITAGRLYLFKQSIEDWQHYLKQDRSGNWTEEAKQRMSEVRGTVDAHDRRTNAPLLTAREFARNVDAGDPKTWKGVGPRIEDYLSTAITDWLPAAFPVGGTRPPSEQARQALTGLSKVLREDHRDLWLTDLLSTTSSPLFGQAIEALANAVKADQLMQDYSMARKESVRAAALFDRTHNPAGSMRAQFEEIYSLHFSDLMPECLSRSLAVSERALRRSYRWIQIQASLENASCFDVDLERSADWAARGHQAATEANFSYLSLRALGFVTAAQSESGTLHKAWESSRQGLGQYWSDSTRPMPGHNVYIFLGRIAGWGKQWSLETAFESQATALLPPAEAPVTLAVEHTRAGRAATLGGWLREAQYHFDCAKRLLDSAPQTEVTQNYHLGIEIDLARVLGDSGQTQAALETLERLRPRLEKIPNQTSASDYYLALGDLQVSADTRSAEETFSLAVGVAEQQRASLRSEGERATWAAQSEYYYRRLVEAKVANQDPENALAVLEMYNDADVRPPFSSAHISDVRQAIARQAEVLNQSLPLLRDRTVLVYSVLSSGLMVWVYDQHGITGQLVNKNPADIRLLARRFGELCSTPSSSLRSVNIAAHQLYEILIAPVQDHIPPHQPLVIEAGADLRSVPFQALMANNGSYLVDEHPITYSPGIDYLARDLPGESGITSDDNALVIASAGGNEEEGLLPLEDAVAEAKDVARRFDHVQLFADGNTSLSSVKDGLPAATVFHFSGHAIAGRERSGLLLSAGSGQNVSLLDSSLLRRVPLARLRLAVLSACSTERGALGSFLDQTSLARTFLQAGTPHVVATRWNVDSQSSAALMRSFYDQLFSGISVSAALAAAESQRRLTSAHPYYWAAFDAFGK
jgi:CHAT domain-containing protein